MHADGLQPNRPYRKCARVVGDVMGSFHPHGDSAIYDTLVRLAQDFAQRYPLVDGQGNFGSIDNDPAAAMRYTEARLAPARHRDAARHRRGHRRLRPQLRRVARCEPLVLPSRYPNLLVNGSAGIAVGMATNIPPHNLREVIDATIAYIDDPTIDAPGLMKHIKGPDFPTGGIDRRLRTGIKEAYETGRGRVVIRAQGAHRAAAPGQGGDHRHRDALPGVEGRRAQRRLGPDQEDRRGRAERQDPARSPTCATSRTSRGIRLVIELKRDAIPKVVLNKLYKHTPMQTTFGVNMVALVDGVPRTLGLRAADQQLRRPPARGRSSGAPSTSCAGPRPAPTSSRACSSRSTTSTR